MAEKLAQLEKKISTSLDTHIEIWEAKGKRHRYTNNSLIVVSIVMSIAITISGIYDQGILTAILGATLAGILAFQQAFPFGEMSFFYRVGVAEAKMLKLNLDTRADTPEEAEALGIKVETLIYKMAQDIPRGQAVHDIVSNMREEVREA